MKSVLLSYAQFNKIAKNTFIFKAEKSKLQITANAEDYCISDIILHEERTAIYIMHVNIVIKGIRMVDDDSFVHRETAIKCQCNENAERLIQLLFYGPVS